MLRVWTLLLALPCLLSSAEPDPVPVMRWSFSEEKDAGPRAPRYPGFPADNTARYFSGNGKETGLRVPDSAELRFDLKERITFEAWVRLDGESAGAPYLLGKGRLRSPGFPEQNQSYAFRLQFNKGQAQVGFLFASAAVAGKKSEWHRWWTKESFALNSGWHHIAVSYKYGSPTSVFAVVDGQLVKEGVWDMGGATDRAPVVDAEDAMLGSGSTLTASHSLHGWLDEVALYRGDISEEWLMRRYQFIPPPPAISQKDVPAGRVLVQLAEEGMLPRNAWPAEPPKVAEEFQEDLFGFFDLPLKYEQGVRADRHVPFLYRAAAQVTLPKGKHRLLLRARGATLLYVDGKQLLSTPFPPNDSDGHHLMSLQKDYLDLGPDFRFAPPGNREAWCEIVSTGKPQFFVLETLVGSYAGKNKRRPELGETIVAWSREGTESWELLSPGERKVSYTDASWQQYEQERLAHYEVANDKRRAQQRQEQSGYWAQRQEHAEAWLAQAAAVKVPALPKGYPAQNEVDHFLAARLDKVKAQAAPQGGVDFFKDVQPLLEAKCAECHRGSKAKGGLRLDTLAAAMAGGDADGAAISPGKPSHSSLLTRVNSTDEDEIMPPKGKPLNAEERALLERWIKEGASWPEIRADHVTLTPLTDDLSFLRRLYLDTVGVPPSLAEIAAFEKQGDRAKAIQTVLQDKRWADHWMGYWQDVLAENPNMLNPTLNNTGPFRWWLYESLRDNKPMNLFVTELLNMRGSERLGGPAGFGIASQNDVPMAAKGTIVSTAFLGVEMKCARCHDSPTHKSLQSDLFQLAAMLGQKEIAVPTTSSVPMDKIHAGGRKPLIQVTLKPGTKVQPKWPFSEFCDESAQALAADPTNMRDVLAAMITAPQNERFAQVMVNRLWARLMGRGIVEPVEDWERGIATHPELLKWLGRELVRGSYDMKHVAKIILSSHAYQRATDPALKQTSPLFTSPAPRRLYAEQIVDSLFATTGKPFRTEEICLDIDNQRDLNNSITLGKPHRSWMLTSTSNERDRPSLSLPRIQAMCDVLGAFGWRGARQDPASRRESDPNVLQPAILSNGTVATWLTRLSDDHGITALTLKAKSPSELVDTLFLQLLTRKSSAQEKQLYVQHIQPGFETRALSAKPKPQQSRAPEKYVSWSNHLDPEATLVRQAQEASARAGEPPTERLTAEWRERMENVLWALLNSPEWVASP